MFLVGIGKLSCRQRLAGRGEIVRALRMYTFYILPIVVGKASSRLPRVSRSGDIQRGAPGAVVFLWWGRQRPFVFIFCCWPLNAVELDGLSDC
jgi:hypothetical protein